jgi:hypothetical protein
MLDGRMQTWGMRLGMLAVVLVAACGEDGEDAGVCGAVDSCGGDVVGIWQVDSLCSDQSLLRQVFESELPNECAGSFLNGTLEPAGLTFDFTAEGNWRLGGAVSTGIDYTLDQACLTALVPNAPAVNADFCQQLADATLAQLRMTEDPESTVTCAFTSDSCECGMAYTSDISDMTTYSIVDNNVRANNTLIPYCVSGDSLELQDGELGSVSARRN